MLRTFSRPVPLVLLLALLSFIPVLTAVINTAQIPTGTYPPDSAHLAVAPVSWFLHVLAGAAFGISGPVNFVLALRRRFGRLHRVTGRIFFLSALVLGGSALIILASVEPQRTPIVDIARGVFGMALLVAVAKAMAAIRRRDIAGHRAWVIRAYAIGMGLGTVALVFFPIYLVTGSAPAGAAADLLFAASWSINIGIAEWVIYKTSTAKHCIPS
ncbi:MAG: DUF2306 domain-containing protein [Rhodobacteraceae bacterium]|nr:DUF2306 domain-containing protein [Paracoccaceae bacterium]